MLIVKKVTQRERERERVFSPSTTARSLASNRFLPSFLKASSVLNLCMVE